MKKAYVKPVFFAEEFVGETAYAATGCGTMSWTPKRLYENLQICKEHPGHVVSKKAGMFTDYYTYSDDKDSSNDMTYWDYATTLDRPNAGAEGYTASDAYLFNSGSQICDFVWDNTASAVGVWREQKEADNSTSWKVDWITGFSFGGFFMNNEATITNHHPVYENVLIPS